MASSEEGCYAFYEKLARKYKNASQAHDTEAFAAVAAGVFAPSITNPPVLAGAVTVFGGTTVGLELAGQANAESALAFFAENIAQSIAEAHAQVEGPYTIRLTNDLNDAIYESGRFLGRKSPLNNETKAQLRVTLNGQKISTKQLSMATKLLDQNGLLCAENQGLKQNIWAEYIVSYAINQQ